MKEESLLSYPRNGRSRTAQFFHLAMAVSAGVGITACKKATPQVPPPPPSAVEVFVTKAETIPATFQHIGQVDTAQSVEVRSRVEGVVMSQGFEEGTSVTEGDFLFRIDPREFEANLLIADSKVQNAQVSALSEQRNLVRLQKLASSSSGNVSREEVEDAQTKYNLALAALKVAEADRYKANLELSYTTVTATISGKIGQAERKTGDLVDTTENSLLATIVKQDPIYVKFHVSERVILDYKHDIASGRFVEPADTSRSVTISLLDGTKYPLPGVTNFTDIKIDPETGTSLVRAEFPNPDGILVPGQYVKATLHGAVRPNAILVPQRAVQQGMQGSYVYVVDGERNVEMRPVTATNWEGGAWIIESGLKAGEQIIVNGVQKARPGSRVNVTTVSTQLDYTTLAADAGGTTTRSAER